MPLSLDADRCSGDHGQDRKGWVALTGHRRVRLLHTSDVHLGWDTNSVLVARALSAVVNTAKSLNADVVLIAGDLFDHSRVTTQTIDFGLSELNRLERPVVLLPGNHDCFDAGSIYRKVDVEAESSNVKLIRGETGEFLRLPDLGITFWGKAMVEHHPDFRPLSDVPERVNGDWFVGLGHGHFEPKGTASGRSSPIYPNEIAAAPCDYIALGHWHIPLDISQEGVIARYSGSPAGSGFTNTLGEVSVVDLDPVRGVTVRPHQLLDRIAEDA